MKTYRIQLWKNGSPHGSGYFDASVGQSSSFNLRDCSEHVTEEERRAIELALSEESPPQEGKVEVATYAWKLTRAAA